MARVEVRTVTEAYTGQPPLPRYTGMRGLYRGEGGNDHAYNMPAVIPNQWNGVKNQFGVWFTKEMQFLSWELTQATNPLMDSMDWAAVWNGDRMLTNNNGWDSRATTDQRRDYVNNRYSTWDDPKVMDALWCAGSMMPYMENRGDGHLWAVPGKSGIDCNKPMPTVQQVLDRNWYFTCTVNPKEGSTQPFDFPQGKGGHVVVPFFLIKDVSYTRSHFEWWDDTVLPNPLRFGG